MTHDEQITICKALAITCMWGQGGIASVFLERLQKALPTEPSWEQVYGAQAGAAEREYLGVITDEAELLRYMSQGYWLVNGNSLFYPLPSGGLCKYVSKDLYAKHGPRS